MYWKNVSTEVVGRGNGWKCAGLILAVFTVALSACTHSGAAGRVSRAARGGNSPASGARVAKSHSARLFATTGVEESTAIPTHMPGQPMNPALRKFGPAVSFYQSCNHLPMVATMSCGDGAPTVAGVVCLRAGLYGRALLTGKAAVSYAARGNINLSRGGSLALWLCAYHWQDMKKHLPYIFFVQVNDHGRQLLIGRMGVLQNHEALEVYLAGAKKSVCIVPGNTLQWKNRQWHLLVVNWTAGSVEVSLDGGVWQQSAPPSLEHLHGPPGQLTLGDVHASLKQRCLLDEFMVLNRPMSMAEVRWLYRQKE